jgi:hypothetical protein
MGAPYLTRCLWLSCALSLFLSAGVRGAEPDPETKAMMLEIVQALRVVVPLSLNRARFSDPTNRAAVDAALDSLVSAMPSASRPMARVRNWDSRI